MTDHLDKPVSHAEKMEALLRKWMDKTPNPPQWHYAYEMHRETDAFLKEKVRRCEGAKLTYEQLVVEIDRLRAGLQLIVDGTIVPEAFHERWDKYDDAQQLHISALLIAQCTLEGGESPASREYKETQEDAERYRFICRSEADLDTDAEEILAEVWHAIIPKGVSKAQADAIIDDGIKRTEEIEDGG